MRPATIAEFLILDGRMPRSLLYCLRKASANIGHLCTDYNIRPPSLTHALAMRDLLEDLSIERIIDSGLHEFLTGFIRANNALAAQVERDFRFSS